METLQLDKNKARKLYPTASAEFKTMLEDTFGKSFFSEKITDRVKSFGDACNALGLNPGDSYNVDDKMYIIIKALNEGWVPNWKDSDEAKYYCWFKFNGSGFVLGDVNDCYQYSGVSSRLCFKSRELAEYCAKQFQTEFNNYLTAL